MIYIYIIYNCQQPESFSAVSIRKNSLEETRSILVSRKDLEASRSSCTAMNSLRILSNDTCLSLLKPNELCLLIRLVMKIKIYSIYNIL